MKHLKTFLESSDITSAFKEICQVIRDGQLCNLIINFSDRTLRLECDEYNH